jgi:hypothetical protein
MIALSGQFLLLLLVFSAAALSQAQSGPAGTPESGSQARARRNCPWITEGSAARILGEDVSLTVNISDVGEGSCKFMRPQEPLDFLEVNVSKATVPTCPPQSRTLKGVGNQASMCKPSSLRAAFTEMVSGRVRDLNFTVTIAFNKRRNPASATDMNEDALEQIAEQVAGNLF